MKPRVALQWARWYGSVSRPSTAAQVIQSLGNEIGRLSAAAWTPPEPGTERWIRETEHELMIAGHETDCRQCAMERRERYTVNGVCWAPGTYMDEDFPWFAQKVREAIDNGESRSNKGKTY